MIERRTYLKMAGRREDGGRGGREGRWGKGDGEREDSIEG